MQALVRPQRLGAVQISIRDLEAGVRRRIDGEATGPGVQRPEVEVPAVLVGLAPMEERALELEKAVVDARGQDSEGDVRRVLPMVTDGWQRIAHRRGPMHECGRTERGFAGRGRVQLDTQGVADRVPVDRRRLHEEIVGMLPIVQRPAAVGLAALQKKRQRLFAAEGGRLRREHASERELSAEQRMRSHAHQPARRCHTTRSAVTPLVVVADGRGVMEHEHPVTGHEVMRVDGRGIRTPAGARSFARVRELQVRAHALDVPLWPVMMLVLLGHSGASHQQEILDPPARLGARPVHLAGMAESHVAVRSDDEARRQRLDAPRRGRARIAVEQQGKMQPEIVCGVLRGARAAPHLHRQDRESLARERGAQPLDAGQLVAARLAPGGPEIQQNHVSAVVREALRLAVRVRQSERRRHREQRGDEQRHQISRAVIVYLNRSGSS